MSNPEPRREHYSLLRLLREYAPPMCESWEEWWDAVASSRTVEELKKELQSQDFFREPVILSAAEDDVDEDTGEVTHYRAVVGNGMHRLATHYFLQKDQVYVQHGHTPLPEREEEEAVFLVLQFSGEGDVWERLEDVEDHISWAPSFSGAPSWVTCEWAFGRGNIMHFQMEGPDTSTDLEALAAEARERLQGLPATVIGARRSWYSVEREQWRDEEGNWEDDDGDHWLAQRGYLPLQMKASADPSQES